MRKEILSLPTKEKAEIMKDSNMKETNKEEKTEKERERHSLAMSKNTFTLI